MTNPATHHGQAATTGDHSHHGHGPERHGDSHTPLDSPHDAHGGHEDHSRHGHHGDHAAQFRNRFWLTMALTIPVVAYSHMIQEWFRFTPPHFPGSALVAPVLGTIIFVYGGRPFLEGGWQELRRRSPGMMLLISLAIVVAFAASGLTTLGVLELDFWWELAALIAIMLLGHWLEMRAIGEARGALAALAELVPDEAERIEDGGPVTVPVSDLRPGDVVLVRPGGRVPADGTVTEGAGELDESMVTGESRPVPKEPGDTVSAGTVAVDSSLRLRVDAVGEDTALAGIRRLVADAQSSRSRAQVLADRFAALLFYVALSAGIVTAVVWTLLGRPDDAVTRTVTVLVIACPHALGLAIPLVVAISTSLSARNGILVKDRLALERMRRVDTVLFDKTGTLTKGSHVLTDVVAADGDSDALVRMAAAVEAESEHPLARAIRRAAEGLGELPAARGFRTLPGRGVTAEVDGRAIGIGGPAFLREAGAELPQAMAEAAERWRAQGAAILTVVHDGEVLGALAFADEVREESRAAVAELHALGIRVALITGDAGQVAEAVGAELGIDEIFAEVLPADKDKAVRDLQARGHTVAMVGDGVNDAPALARADVGIAIGAGTDVAIESAGIVLASDDPRAVLSVHRLSRAGYRKMIQNLAWAAGYNVVAIPLAAGALAWAGVVLAPAVGAILMSLSTIVVAFNAQLLRRTPLRVT